MLPSPTEVMSSNWSKQYFGVARIEANSYISSMPTFIDESGDIGSVRSGGKSYFRLAAVWIPTLDDAEYFRDSIRQLRRDLGLRSSYEFKFVSSHHQPERREAFFQTALAHPFQFAVCAIDKSTGYWKRASGSEQQWATTVSLAVLMRNTYLQSEVLLGPPLREPIIVDDNEDREFLRVVTRSFRGLSSVARPGSSLVGQVAFRSSAAEDVLQLVDMVCGATGAFLDGDDPSWYRMIADREIETLRLP